MHFNDRLEQNTRDRGEFTVGDLLKVGAVLGIAYIAVDALQNKIPNMPNLPGEVVDLEPDPEEAVASVNHESYAVEVDFDVTCTRIVSAAVDVDAFKRGYEVLGVDVGNGEFEKQVWGDFLLCGDNSQTDSAAHAREFRDPVTKAVTKLEIQIDGLQVTHPRIDFLDPRNCVDGNIGDSVEDIERKLAEYKAEKEAGEEPGCDDGFKVSRAGGPDELAEAIDIGYKAAQLALAVDANPVDIIREADAEYAGDVENQLRSQSRYADTDIDVIVHRPDGTDSVQQQLDLIKSDLTTVFNKVEFGTDDKGDYMYVEASGDSHATVRLGGYAGLSVDELVLSPPVETFGTQG